jgi:RHS repeat-associated protein
MVGGQLNIYEGGGLVGNFGSYVPNVDVLRVAVEGGVVKYRKNGLLLYTSTAPPSYPLLVDTSLYSTGCTLSNVLFFDGTSGGGGGGNGTQNASWTNTVGVTVSGNSLTSTGNGWNTSGAVSTQSIASGDGYVEFKASEANTYRMIGLSHGDTNQNFDDIDFAFYLMVGGQLNIYEGGGLVGNFGSYVPNVDVLRVAVEGGVVKYLKNGLLLYTSTVAPAYPLLVDTSLYSTGCTLSNVLISGATGGSGGGSSSAQIHWLVADQLGTPRMIFDQSGSLANVSRHDYLPFGEELFGGPPNQPGLGGRTTTQGYSGDSTRQKFTQKERDNETGLDYFINRYYSSTQGRFNSADPESAGVAESEPQSWNGYAYVGNAPLTSTDSFGLWKEIECSSGKGRCWESDKKTDTITSLAKILNVSATALNKFFQNPTVHIGDGFDASGFGRGSIPTSRDQGSAVVRVFLVSEPESTGAKISRFFSNDESQLRGARMDKFWHDLFNPCNGPGQPRCQIGIMYPGGIASGLRTATPELAELFASGTIRNMPIISIRNTLRQGGFTQTVTRNGSGYLFRNAAGEEVRIMSRGGGWDVRIMNSNGNYLDEFGNVGTPASSHGISVRSQ